MQNLTVIGSTESIDLPKFGIFGVPAKIDTGADLSSIWATEIVHDGGQLRFRLFGPTSAFYTGEDVVIGKSGFETAVIINSFGHKEERYKVKLPLVVGGRKIRASITLSNRENTTYPVLLGRRLLAKKFLVDVSKRPIDLKKSNSVSK